MYKREKSKELFVCFYLLKSIISKILFLIPSISLVTNYWFFNSIVYNSSIKVFNFLSYKKCQKNDLVLLYEIFNVFHYFLAINIAKLVLWVFNGNS